MYCRDLPTSSGGRFATYSIRYLYKDPRTRVGKLFSARVKPRGHCGQLSTDAGPPVDAQVASAGLFLEPEVCCSRSSQGLGTLKA